MYILLLLERKFGEMKRCQKNNIKKKEEEAQLRSTPGLSLLFVLLKSFMNSLLDMPRIPTLKMPGVTNSSQGHLNYRRPYHTPQMPLGNNISIPKWP